MPKLLKNIALIVAAGTSTRLKNEIPKQYLTINNQSILAITVSKFLNHPEIDGVTVVINKDHKSFYEESTHNLDLLPPIIGGKERKDSVRLGLLGIAKYNPEIVLIHDAARMFVTSELIHKLMVEVKHYDGVVPVCSVTDTIKQVNEESIIERTLPRTKLFNAQTPQVFRYQTILKSHLDLAEKYFTDDASLLEYQNIPVKGVATDSTNFKITNPKDLLMAKFLLGEKDEK
jgi:2-C-methyl-D-erythritol 4-phosphate cytidylyltransferase/2-C-methyl-D-erythritol 2,4-cyclodiphosphate synthase